ncbi:hypothetical protein BC937DRAFT_92703 [Endogone sp. FLAS-F59071]|nr:hypothetical protein BC937DRAFT_92703 [Endogone sp. FLAS-F59071]|eukprot:RUS15248.1 hypothetical protein BC937DRAFT_92703 [Endogone sp. FLAS-F59071]
MFWDATMSVFLQALNSENGIGVVPYPANLLLLHTVHDLDRLVCRTLQPKNADLVHNNLMLSPNVQQLVNEQFSLLNNLENCKGRVPR